MSCRTSLLLIYIFIAVTVSTQAQDRKWLELSGGYSFLRLNPTPGLQKALPTRSLTAGNLHGWNLGVTLFPKSWLGIEFEVSRHSGTIQGTDKDDVFPNDPVDTTGFRNLSVLAGPRIRAIKSGCLSISFSALFGVDDGKQTENHASFFYDGGLSKTHFASSLGCCIDVAINRRITLRLIEPRVYILRGNIDALGAQATSANLLFSSGLVFRLGGK